MSYTPKGYINIGGNVYPKETRTRRKSAPALLPLLRDALEQAGRSLDNADIPWPWDKSLFVRADAALAEAPKAEEGKPCR